MEYGITYTSQPLDDRPLAVSEAMAACRLDSACGEDSYFRTLVMAARDLAERYTGRLFGPRTATITLSAFPRGGPLELPVEPVRAVTAVRYRDWAGTLTTLDPSAYQTALSFSPPLVAPAAGACWPQTQCGGLAAVEIDVDCGPEPTGNPNDIPVAAKQAMSLAVAYWYDNRGGGGDPEKLGLPPAARMLLDLLDTGGR